MILVINIKSAVRADAKLAGPALKLAAAGRDLEGESARMASGVSQFIWDRYEDKIRALAEELTRCDPSE